MRSNKESGDCQSNFKARSGRGYKNRTNDNARTHRARRDRSCVRCFNCNVLGQYAAECKRSRPDRNFKPGKLGTD